MAGAQLRVRPLRFPKVHLAGAVAVSVFSLWTLWKDGETRTSGQAEECDLAEKNITNCHYALDVFL